MIETTKLTNLQPKTFENDFLNILHYTLPNGLQLFLNVNRDEPRVFTNIAVRAGSKQDPAETTGLAHYMEHMLFKGTSKIGTLNWEEEKVQLQKISDLYEKHRQTTDPEEKKKIYKAIDQQSFEAAKLVAANEYDKLASAIGAQKTNAYTWVEQTVYVNEIPANEIERWMELESERFNMMALRLFHTELETVYEEFNITQDNDYRKSNKALKESLFPKHPYGTQTTIGTAQDLKNPSHVNIQWYFNTYYVPNNMAIMMSGDFDPEQVVQWAQQYFGHYEAKTIPPFHFEDQPSIDAPIHKKVIGKDAAYVQIGWRLPGGKSEASLPLLLLSNLLYNNKAGLIDINLNQPQQVLQSAAYYTLMEDYSTLVVYGRPREGQSLETVEQLLLDQIERLKSGDFEDWLIEAVINDLQIDRFGLAESNADIVQALTSNYIIGVDWQDFTNQIAELKKITKAELCEFAKTHIKDNFVSVFKEQGQDDSVIKVDKPEITAIPIDRAATSEFANNFLSKKTTPLSPVFVDYEEAIQKLELSNGTRINKVDNPHNSLTRLDFIFEIGKFNDRLVPLALTYLSYLGTSKYSATQIKQNLYRIGMSLDPHAGNYRSYLSLSGLENAIEEGLQMLTHLLEDIQPNEAALANVVDDILKKRENAKKDRNYLLRQGLLNYGKYGAISPVSYKLSTAELKAVTSEQLIQIIKQLFNYPHEVYYYGQNSIREVAKLLDKYQNGHRQSLAIPATKIFEEKATDHNSVFIFDFPIVQTDILMISKGTEGFNLEEYLFGEIYNEYFGYGLSSVVFQEIREAKALAYSTYAFYGSPGKKDHAHNLRAYVGTQPDKMKEAILTLGGIIKDMPVALNQIEQARQSIIKKIESERIIPSKRFWEAKKWADRGIAHDTRKDMYSFMQKLTPEDLINFQQKNIKDRKFSYLLLGNKANLDMDFLGSLGPVKEIGLEDLFGSI